VAPIVQKMVETRLRWFGDVERTHVDYVIRRVDQMKGSQITITRGSGRPRKTKNTCRLCNKESRSDEG